MARRLIKTIIGVGSTITKVYRDAEWDEYQVDLHWSGVKQQDSTYHTDDKQDALDTAAKMSEWTPSAQFIGQY